MTFKMKIVYLLAVILVLPFVVDAQYVQAQYYNAALTCSDISQAYQIVINTTTTCSNSCTKQGDIYIKTVCSPKSVSVPVGSWSQRDIMSTPDCRG